MTVNISVNKAWNRKSFLQQLICPGFAQKNYLTLYSSTNVSLHVKNLTTQVPISFKPSSYFDLVLCSWVFPCCLPALPNMPGQNPVAESQPKPAAQSIFHGALGARSLLGQRAGGGFSPQESKGLTRKHSSPDSLCNSKKTPIFSSPKCHVFIFKWRHFQLFPLHILFRKSMCMLSRQL